MRQQVAQEEQYIPAQDTRENGFMVDIVRNAQGKLETGRVPFPLLAGQADGSITIRQGGTVVLVTAVSSASPREGIDFFPLTVDVEERMYAAGKIPGGFFRREGRPSEQAILAARLIDRPLRPCFPEGYRNDVHVIATILSVDQENPPDVLAINAASAALTVSDIPFQGPVAAVRIGRVDGNFVVNPTFQELEQGDMEIIVAGKKGSILMVEAGSSQIGEEDVLQAFRLAQEEIDRLVTFQEELQREMGSPKRAFEPKVVDEALASKVSEAALGRVKDALRITDKQQRKEMLNGIEQELIGEMAEDLTQEAQIKKAMKSLEKEEMRRMIVEESRRSDGRRPEEIRPIGDDDHPVRVGLLPRTHGTGLFTRGQTQVLTICTLGAVGEEQIIDGLGIEESKRFLHHYNFPPFSTGEVGRMTGPRRREIGHGALVERALGEVIPDEETFPYTVRLVSEVLSSNGSTSMASVCGGSLALHDAGVPIPQHVAGIAMGLIKREDTTVILTDILGMEDALGDMDFKVAGTRTGITALQMDMKIAGISHELLREAVEAARVARLAILEKMERVIARPRQELSPFAPRVLSMRIHPDKIRDVIGAGGKTIRGIIDATGASIDIEDDGVVFITAKNAESGLKAKEMVERLTKDVEIGEKYLGKVVKTAPFGAFVQILPGKDGLVHISRLTKGHVRRVEDVVNVGDTILVEVIDIDRDRKISLAARDLHPEQGKEEEDS